MGAMMILCSGFGIFDKVDSSDNLSGLLCDVEVSSDRGDFRLKA